MSKKFIVHDKEGKEIYPIVIQPDFSQLATALSDTDLNQRKICIVSDSVVAPLYYRQVAAQFAQLMGLTLEEAESSGRIIRFVFPNGEQSKNLTVVADLYEKLILAHFDRKDCLVALGGGVVGDLTGYTAATYLRGIRFIQVPTTLLSQVDSSVGGKTGVDFNQYKNMVGAFYMPILVYMNTGALLSLSDRDYYSGMAEVIKYGLIVNDRFYEYIKEHTDAIINRDLDVLEYITYTSADTKRMVVEEDPTEQGIRALLNMGHTAGHAIEKMMNFALMHGECVSIGCMVSAYISYKRGYITQEVLEDISNTFKNVKLPVFVPDTLEPAEVAAVTKSDKKMDRGQIRFILMKSIGDSYIDQTVTMEEMTQAIAACTNR